MPEYDPQIDYNPDLLLADAIIGHECERFWSSQLGRYIKGRAKNEIQDFMSLLYAAEPRDVKSQTEIRQKIGLRVLMIEYLDEQIRIGQEAKLELEENGD